MGAVAQPLKASKPAMATAKVVGRGCKEAEGVRMVLRPVKTEPWILRVSPKTGAPGMHQAAACARRVPARPS
jgi:hypothetical protein